MYYFRNNIQQLATETITLSTCVAQLCYADTELQKKNLQDPETGYNFYHTHMVFAVTSTALGSSHQSGMQGAEKAQ